MKTAMPNACTPLNGSRSRKAASTAVSAGVKDRIRLKLVAGR